MKALDVWLKFDHWDNECVNLGDGECDYCEYASHEANTFRDGDGYRIEWYLNAVGLVKRVYVDTLEAAEEWYALNGFQDFSS